jgi:hypothetical protein
MRRASSAGSGTLSSSRPCLVKTTRRSVTWHAEQMNVWCSQPRKHAVSSGTTLVRINSAPHAVQRNGRTLTSSPRSCPVCLPCLSKRRRRARAGAGTPGRLASVTRVPYRFANGANLQDPVGGEFIITLRLASGTDRGNGTAKRSDQGRHGRAAVRQIFLLECCH